MGRLLDEDEVYALFAPNGTARLHVADIDVLPRVEHRAPRENGCLIMSMVGETDIVGLLAGTALLVKSLAKRQPCFVASVAQK